MLRKLLKYIIVAAAPLLAACSDEIVDSSTNSCGMLTISLKSSNATRDGETADDSNNNEDLITNVVLAFYPEEYGEDTEPIAVYKPGQMTLTGTNGSTTVGIDLTPEMIKTLFNDVSGNVCKFFALSNLNDEQLAKIGDKTTIADMKSLQISSDFATTKLQSSFVMSGEGSVTYIKNNERDKYATGSGNLVRTAARIRISVAIDTDNDVTDSEGNRWIPVTTSGNIRVILNQGVSESYVTPTEAPSADDYYDITLSQGDLVRNLSYSGSGNFPYTMDVPFYSYPNQWNNSSSEEQHRTSMTLVMTWRREGTSTYRTFYYQVPVTPNEELVSNHAYQVNLTVGMLGSLTPDTTVEIEDVTYQVVNWGSANVDVTLLDTRYLIVNPTSYSVSNEVEIRIPLYSSHDITISSITMSYQLYNFYSSATGNVAEITLSKAVIDNSNNRQDFCTYSTEYEESTGQYYIVIKHPLKIATPYSSNGTAVSMSGNNSGTLSTRINSISYMTLTDDDAFSAFTINVTVQHKDNDSFTDNVTITQYPGMYITPVLNPGGDYLSYYDGSYELCDYGYAYVNPTTEQRNNQTYYINDESLGGLRVNVNRNPNMYIITTTRLESGSSYVIGDPRLTVINNDLSGNDDLTSIASTAAAGTWCNSAQALYGNSPRTLTYYYPTKESDETENMIAPKFRIASQYGALGRVNTHVNRQNARRRLATYQEQNCPAGRWRLPTKAELAYMISLQEKGYIPQLFVTSSSSGYVTAQGAYKVDSNGNLTESTASTYYVRGIYDEWYWEGDTLTPTNDGVYYYTFGDMPRDATRSAALIKAYNSKMSGK